MFNPENKDEGCRYTDEEMAHEMALAACEEFRYYKGWTPTKEQVAKVEEAIKAAFPDHKDYVVPDWCKEDQSWKGIYYKSIVKET